MNSEQANPFH